MNEILTSAVNFSEGRKLDAIHQIAGAAAKHCHLLDVHADPDHNRSVVTLAGEQLALIDGILAAAAKALDHIDLSIHSGAHPRLGAIDVVPFVPAPARAPAPADPADSHFQAAVAASLCCAERLWKELALPCFLYEMSSRTAPEQCLSLPQIRREAFRSLQPDFGTARPHPTAGAAVVGARRLLVAYNLNLDIGDMTAARQIAAGLRNLPDRFVRTLAMPLTTRGLAQVSCNLTRPTVVTIADVFEAALAIADELSVEIIESEVVGLVPKDALGDRSPRSLRLAVQPKLIEECLEECVPPARE